MGLLSRAAILAVNDIKTETVPVPEWGGDVIVKGLSAAERDAYEVACAAGRLRGDDSDPTAGLANMSARLVSLAVVDESGRRLFTDDDIIALGTKSAGPVNRLYGVAKRLAGLSDADVKALEKNSGTVPSGDSSSV